MPDIPSISDYAHHNEEAGAIWYAENRYDMLYGDEIDQDPYDDYEYDDYDPEREMAEAEFERRTALYDGEEGE